MYAITPIDHRSVTRGEEGKGGGGRRGGAGGERGREGRREGGLGRGSLEVAKSVVVSCPVEPCRASFHFSLPLLPTLARRFGRQPNVFLYCPLQRARHFEGKPKCPKMYPRRCTAYVLCACVLVARLALTHVSELFINPPP